MLKTLLLSLTFSSIVGNASADHFNQRNMIELCKEDASFDSACYTYIAAYRDLIGFMLFSSDEDRAKVLCLSNVSTDKIVRRLTVASETERPGQVADLLIDEFCK